MAVHVADEGAQTTSAIQSPPLDIVLMDCQVPVMDGYLAIPMTGAEMLVRYRRAEGA